MNQIRLDDVLARDTGVQWFEGVAILQVICRGWREQGTDDSRFPSAGDVVLGPGGTITLTGATPGHAVQAAAHLLARMLSDDVPVRLRLAVSQATAAETASTSLAAFSEELRYFERPDLEAIVDGVRRRALLAAPRALAVTPQPVETLPKAKKELADPVAKRRVSGWAVAAVAVSAAACALVWVVGRTPIRPSAPVAPIEQPARSAPDKTARAPRTVSHPAGVPVSTTSAATPPSTKKNPPRVSSAEIESTTDVVLLGQLPSRSYFDRIQLVDAAPVVPAEFIAAPAPNAEGDADGDRIYTRTDANVTLPMNVYPKFPTQSAEPDPSRRAVLELTIAKDGLVEGVKMLTAPRNIHEFMLLSAVKAWRFEPARLGGRAIRFRQTLMLDAATVGWMGAK